MLWYTTPFDLENSNRDRDGADFAISLSYLFVSVLWQTSDPSTCQRVLSHTHQRNWIHTRKDSEVDTFQHVQYIIYNFVLKFPEQDQAKKVCRFNFQIPVVQQATFYRIKNALYLHGCVQLRSTWVCATSSVGKGKISVLYLWVTTGQIQLAGSWGQHLSLSSVSSLAASPKLAIIEKLFPLFSHTCVEIRHRCQKPVGFSFNRLQYTATTATAESERANRANRLQLSTRILVQVRYSHLQRWSSKVLSLVLQQPPPRYWLKLITGVSTSKKPLSLGSSTYSSLR